MLQELYISNLALIDKAKAVFGDGLNVLTGETGAGKTVVVGAVNLLLGGRAGTSLIRRDCTKAEVEGVFSVPKKMREDETVADLFDDEDEHIIIRRIISADGKNKCYINDRMVTLAKVQEIGKRLIDLHGQHEHQSLFKISSHIDFLDKYGGAELLQLREAFIDQSKRFKQLKDGLAHLKGAERELLGKKDLLQFQIGEIDSADLSPNEDEELTHERDILRNAEKLYTAVAGAAVTLDESGESMSATELIAQAAAELKHVSGIDTPLDEITGRLDSLLIEVEDCVAGLRDYGTTLDFPPGRLQEVEDCLALLSLLKRKYGATIEDILRYRDQAAAEMALCDTSEERKEALQAEISQKEKELARIAFCQSNARKQFAKAFSAEVKRELAELNMPNAQFEVLCIREQDSEGLLVDGGWYRLYSTGIDKIEFMVSANKGEPVKPLIKIASGGEISRIMLALKIVLADADEVSTLIFDEVDVGIGGKTAMAVGQKMAVLARKHQVIAVTHLPQIASYADRHFNVVKSEKGSRTVTEIGELLDRDRIDEMARLLSGNAESDVSLKHAEELLSKASKSKRGTVHGTVN
ncbi:MAG TPA: DNA repair protein RecN [Candidatus Aquicultor sp.]|jgi:DNA repair protein RecN (Recombination protein N)